MSSSGLHEAIRAMHATYLSATKTERSALLDHICEVFRVHRKHAVRLFAHPPEQGAARRGRPRVYNHDALVEPLLCIWRVSNLICAKRLVSCLPLWVPYYRNEHGHPLSAKLQGQLCALSASTIDRLLQPHRLQATKLGFATTKPGSLLRKQIPIRTNQWDETRPGFIEADTVAHCGGSMAGMFVYTVAIVDIATGWVEHRAVWGRGERGVRKALTDIEAVLPFALRGFDCDNGSEFLNNHLLKHFTRRRTPVEFTRSRPYQKNDNAHIEEKNWTRVRQYLGYARFEHQDILPLLNELYTGPWSHFHNYFLPSVKLLDKYRYNGRIIKIHDEPKTPCQRVIDHPEVPRKVKRQLKQARENLNPFDLQRSIKRIINNILKLASYNG